MSTMVKPREGPNFKEKKVLSPRFGNSRSSIPKVGKRTRKRQAMNRELGKLRISECEIKLKGCWRRTGLTWAHSRKSRFLVLDKDWKEAARSCLYCHQIIEVMKHSQMHKIIVEAIARRKQ